MKIIVVDDERLQLLKLVGTIEAVKPEAEVVSFSKSREMLDYVKTTTTPPDVAFLDINMPGMTGIELAIHLKDVNPKINIIFVTAYSQYKADAMDMRASGYIVKPVSKEAVRIELEDLRYEPEPKKNALLRVQCFGNFDIFDKNNEPLTFDRSKARELLAFLVYKNGSRCTSKELASVLFDTDDDSKKTRDYFQHVVSSMMKALRKVGAEDVIVRSRQNYAIRPELIDCDYYRFLELDANAVNAYVGEFMSQYSWAEFVTGYLENNILKL